MILEVQLGVKLLLWLFISENQIAKPVLGRVVGVDLDHLILYRLIVPLEGLLLAALQNGFQHLVYRLAAQHKGIMEQ